MSNHLTLELKTPEGDIANYIQAIWYATAHSHGEQWLACDGATGVIFPLAGALLLDDKALSPPYAFQETSTHAAKITFSENAQFCGIRFNPTVLAEFKHHNHPLICEQSLMAIAKGLQKNANLQAFEALISTHFNYQPSIGHTYAKQLISKLIELTPLQTAYQLAPLSKRQLERQIKSQCGVTPKYFERIYRVKMAKQTIKDNPTMGFADIAQQCGFTDQPHFIKEFKAIMHITPARYRKLLNNTHTKKTKLIMR
ncbi:helix-turn-helix domain-containing protein [Pseudoalteromonas sp. CF6-2]|uniref:helix-turn-helix domain-containing protein n=1 Tax=unclassified Pseudoalteromonas TaxID=194690 RepID=UPI00187E5559|nr:helix-turn-helix domain-containing protein [Lelliottia steviae]UJX26506.1 helix-turn-helix domain-containing protein [Pseudoalteromonas sp. CF6-2]